MTPPSKERRKNTRNGTLANEVTFIEIEHSFGSVKRSVYKVKEYDELGLSFFVPVSDGYFLPGTPIKFALVKSDQSKIYSLGTVRHYHQFDEAGGKSFYKVGVQMDPSFRDHRQEAFFLQQRHSPRVSKKIVGRVKNEKVIIENISLTGGFLTGSKDFMTGAFDLLLQANKYKTISLRCATQWSNGQGVGFKILSIEEGKQDLFKNYVDRWINEITHYGPDRVFRTEIFIALHDTNAFGNVYFAEFFKFQGIARERMLLHHVPDFVRYSMEKGVVLVTIDAYNQYIKNAYFGETIVAEVTTKNLLVSQATLLIRFRNKATGEVIGSGYQSFCCRSLKTGSPIKMPSVFEFLEFYNEVE